MGSNTFRVPRRPNLLVHVGASFASTRRAISLSWLYCSKTIRTKHSDRSRRSNATSSRRSKATSPTRGEWSGRKSPPLRSTWTRKNQARGFRGGNRAVEHTCAIAARSALHFPRFGHFSSSYLVPRSTSCPSRRASFFRSAFSVPAGMEGLSASTTCWSHRSGCLSGLPWLSVNLASIVVRA